MVRKYSKKPIVVEAIEVTEGNWEEICKFVKEEAFGGGIYLDDKTFKPILGLKIKTLEGVMLAKRGDYIIKGVNGEFYPIKKEIFKKTYNEEPM